MMNARLTALAVVLASAPAAATMQNLQENIETATSVGTTVADSDQTAIAFGETPRALGYGPEYILTSAALFKGEVVFLDPGFQSTHMNGREVDVQYAATNQRHYPGSYESIAANSPPRYLVLERFASPDTSWQELVARAQAASEWHLGAINIVTAAETIRFENVRPIAIREHVTRDAAANGRITPFEQGISRLFLNPATPPGEALIERMTLVVRGGITTIDNQGQVAVVQELAPGQQALHQYLQWFHDSRGGLVFNSAGNDGSASSALSDQDPNRKVYIIVQGDY